MDILAAMLAYLVCAGGIVGALAVAFVAFFSPPGLQPAARAPAQAMAQAMAMTVRPSVVRTVAAAKPPATIERPDGAIAAAAVKTKVAMRDVAIDARQKPLASHKQLRQLFGTERAKRLAYREGSSFESRFLHYDD